MKITFWIASSLLGIAIFVHLVWLPDTWVIFMALVLYVVLMVSSYLSRSSQPLKSVEPFVIYEFHKKKGNVLFLSIVKSDEELRTFTGLLEPYIEKYDGTEIAVEERIISGISKYCELIKTPAQKRLEPTFQFDKGLI